MIKSVARIVAIALATVSPVLAGDGWSLSATPYASHAFDADLNDAGSLSVTRAGLSFDFGQKLNESTFIGLSLYNEYSNYDFETDAGPDDLLFFDLRPSVSKYLNKDFGLYGGLMLSAGAESGADWGDSFDYGAFAGFNWQVAPDFWIGTGVAFSTQIEDHAFIVPLLSIDWKISDQLSLDVSGLRATLSYKIDDAWTAFVEGKYEVRRFRLSDEGATPDGVLSDESIPLGVGVRFTPNDNVTISLMGGAVVWRQIELIDDDENRLSQDDADVAGYAAASVKLAF